MSWWEILIIVLAAGFVVTVATVSIVRKMHGKTGCGCGCANCPHATSCRPDEKKK